MYAQCNMRKEKAELSTGAVKVYSSLFFSQSLALLHLLAGNKLAVQRDKNTNLPEKGAPRQAHRLTPDRHIAAALAASGRRDKVTHQGKRSLSSHGSVEPSSNLIMHHQ